MPDEDTGLDVEKAVSEIASGLDLGQNEETDKDIETDPSQTDPVDLPPVVTDPPVETPTVRTVPKSWPKEMHEHWGKTDPKVQEYWETREKQMLDGLEQYKGDAGFGKQLRDVITPYNAMLQSQGVDAPKAVQFLLNAHYQLTNSQPAERTAHFARLAKQYGIDLSTVKTDETTDPKVKALEDRVNQLHNSLTTREQAALTEARARVAKDVETFASDPLHPYFDEVADDIVAMLQTGLELPVAYEKAVWANPVTRQKEIARLNTESETKLRDKAKAEAEKALKASGSNVRSRDTRKAPTEPKGSMEDTMKETLSEIRSRAH